MILIPFGIGAALTTPSTLSLASFKVKISQYAPLPLYLLLCLLIVLIQIFSVSITSLLYFFITVYIFWMKSFNFRDTYFKAMLILVQITTTITISLTFLTTCPSLASASEQEVYEFIGINSLNDFSSSAFDRGHFIC